jgi:hypothetical protein
MVKLLKHRRKTMNDKVLSQITALPNKSAAELKTLWKELYQQEPPAFNKPYYLKRLAYRLQELACGVDTRPLERKLEIHARQHLDAKGQPLRKPRKAKTLVVGTRLVREHNGEQHQVTVLASGFDYRGQRYKSLSAIARSITGTQWSGPLFFGLKQGGGKA